MAPRGHKKAGVAVVHAMLVTVYHRLTRRTPCHDPCADRYLRRHAERVRHRPFWTLARRAIA